MHNSQGQNVGKQTVVMLLERLGDRFDWLEINEAYYRLAA
jgi:hypothetical protein